MTSIPLETEIGRIDFFARVRDSLAIRRRRAVRTAKQTGVVALVFGLGAALHLMKWTGLLVL